MSDKRNEQIVKELYQKYGQNYGQNYKCSQPSTTSLSKEVCNFLSTSLSNAVKEDENELNRPMTYSEMRARFG